MYINGGIGCNNDTVTVTDNESTMVYNDTVAVADDASAMASIVSREEKAKRPLPTSGNVKVLTILVQFSDVKFRNVSNVRQCYDDFFNSPTLPTAVCPATGKSVNKYWKSASYGKLNLTSVVVGPYTAPKSQSYYGNRTTNNRKELVAFAVDMAAGDVDMKMFDNNGDGWVEAVCVVYAGEGRDVYADKNYIIPHQGFITPVKKDKVYICKYCCDPELYAGVIRGVGSMCHELGHAMGAKDFYDNVSDPDSAYIGTGKWDLMGDGDKNNNCNSPAHPNPWLKAYLWKWSSVQELGDTTRFCTLRPTETNEGQIYRLNTAGGDFYLLENKQQDYINGDNASKNKGLVIFHVRKDMNNAVNSAFWNDNKVNTGHPQRLYAIHPYSQYAVPTGSKGSYSASGVSRSFTNPLAPKPFFTSTTTPNNLGWSQKPLPSPKDITMIHTDIDNCETVVRFMLNPTIEGTYKFCDDETYTIDNVPSAATTKWGCVGDDGQFVKPGLKVTSSDRSSATYIRDGYIAVNPSTGESVPFYSSGKKTLRAVVNLHNQTYTMTKEVDLPIFKYVKIKSHNSMPMYFVGGTYTFSVENLVDGPIDGISWIISGSAMSSSYIEKGKTQISIAPNKAGTLNIRVIDENGCSPYNETSVSYQILQQAVVIPRNPAEGTADFSVVMRSGAESTDGEPSALSAAAFAAFSGTYEEPYNGAYRLELWHKQFGMERSLDMPENNPDTQINIAGLAPGDYIVRLIIGGNVVNTARLRIK